MNAAQIILLIACDEGQHEHAPIHFYRHQHPFDARYFFSFSLFSLSLSLRNSFHSTCYKTLMI